jgi:T-complex protein 1 subunit theta
MAKSMNMNISSGLSGMLKDGHKVYEGVSGAVIRNIEACKGIAAMVRTSLGPNGMNKLVVNHLEKIIVTSDCATIMKELEVQHPAAKMLVLAAEMQENEHGDNTNFVRNSILYVHRFCLILIFFIGTIVCWRIT